MIYESIVFEGSREALEFARLNFPSIISKNKGKVTELDHRTKGYLHINCIVENNNHHKLLTKYTLDFKNLDIEVCLAEEVEGSGYNVKCIVFSKGIKDAETYDKEHKLRPFFESVALGTFSMGG